MPLKWISRQIVDNVGNRVFLFSDYLLNTKSAFAALQLSVGSQNPKWQFPMLILKNSEVSSISFLILSGFNLFLMVGY
jgi:hypothetical protein